MKKNKNWIDCSNCKGTGKIIEKFDGCTAECYLCHGLKGRYTEKQQLINDLKITIKVSQARLRDLLNG
jgi:DnaJ-class molecular chaperone